MLRLEHALPWIALPLLYLAIYLYAIAGRRGTAHLNAIAAPNGVLLCRCHASRHLTLPLHVPASDRPAVALQRWESLCDAAALPGEALLYHAARCLAPRYRSFAVRRTTLPCRCSTVSRNALRYPRNTQIRIAIPQHKSA
jgi:hypothetical protein